MGEIEDYFIVTPSSTRAEMLLEDADFRENAGFIADFGTSRRLFGLKMLILLMLMLKLLEIELPIKLPIS